jgi:hypothetical protein
MNYKTISAAVLLASASGKEYGTFINPQPCILLDKSTAITGFAELEKYNPSFKWTQPCMKSFTLEILDKSSFGIVWQPMEDELICALAGMPLQIFKNNSDPSENDREYSTHSVYSRNNLFMDATIFWDDMDNNEIKSIRFTFKAERGDSGWIDFSRKQFRLTRTVKSKYGIQSRVLLSLIHNCASLSFQHSYPCNWGGHQ